MNGKERGERSESEEREEIERGEGGERRERENDRGRTNVRVDEWRERINGGRERYIMNGRRV